MDDDVDATHPPASTWRGGKTGGGIGAGGQGGGGGDGQSQDTTLVGTLLYMTVHGGSTGVCPPASVRSLTSMAEPSEQSGNWLEGADAPERGTGTVDAMVRTGLWGLPIESVTAKGATPGTAV